MALPALLPSPPASPVAAAYARLAEVFPGLHIDERGRDARLPDGADWIGTERMAAGGEGLDAFLAWDEEQVRQDYEAVARPDVVASFGLHRYAWPVCLLVTLPWFLHRRVPRLPARNVAFHRPLGRLAVRVEEFACLPGDPAAALPGARLVADEEALRAEVRDALAEHFEELLAGFGPRMRRGRRALWGMVTDEIVEGLWYVAALLGEEGRALAELERLMPGTAKPYVGKAGFRELTGSAEVCGTTRSTRDRATCCLFYTLRPEDTCLTCPRTPDAERVHRLAATA